MQPEFITHFFVWYPGIIISTEKEAEEGSSKETDLREK